MRPFGGCKKSILYFSPYYPAALPGIPIILAPISRHIPDAFFPTSAGLHPTGMAGQSGLLS
jgi:hypothetical protein